MLKAWKDLGTLPRGIWFIAVSALVNRAGTMVLPFLTLYAVRTLKFSPAEVGTLLVIYGVVAIACAPLSGRLCDRFGAVRVVEGSLILTGAVILLLPLAESYATLAVALVALSIVSESGRPATMTAIANLVSAAERRKAFALGRLALNLGMSIGPALGGLLAEVSFWWLAVADGLTSIVAGLVLIAGRVRDRPPTAPEKRPPLGGLTDRRFLVFLAATTVMGLVFFQHMSTMPLFMVRDLGIAETTYGLMFTINTILIVLFEVPLIQAISRWSYRWSLGLGALLVAAGFGAMSLATEEWGIALTVVIWTAGEMVLFPTLSASVAALAPEGQVGAYMGWYAMAFGVAFAVGPWAGTALYEATGGTTLWVTCLAVGIVSALLFGTVKTPAASSPDNG